MSRPWRLIIAGGRDFTDRDRLAELAEAVIMDHVPVVDGAPAEVRVVSGMAKGADTLGREWALASEIPVDEYPAAWDAVDVPGAVVRTNRHGHRYNAVAGHQRNQLMAENADALLALPGGRGTADMVARAQKLGLQVFDHRGGPPQEPGPELPFSIVSSRDRNARFDVLGMRHKGRTIKTVKAPGEPGWLGNPYVADDAGGSYTREEATRLFGEEVDRRGEDPEWARAFQELRGKAIGYYKPDEPFIHLQELGRWLREHPQVDSPSPGSPSLALPLGGRLAEQLQLRLNMDPISAQRGEALLTYGAGAATLLGAIAALNQNDYP